MWCQLIQELWLAPIWGHGRGLLDEKEPGVTVNDEVPSFNDIRSHWNTLKDHSTSSKNLKTAVLRWPALPGWFPFWNTNLWLICMIAAVAEQVGFKILKIRQILKCNRAVRALQTEDWERLKRRASESHWPGSTLALPFTYSVTLGTSFLS